MSFEWSSNFNIRLSFRCGRFGEERILRHVSEAFHFRFSAIYFRFTEGVNNKSAKDLLAI